MSRNKHKDKQKVTLMLIVETWQKIHVSLSTEGAAGDHNRPVLKVLGLVKM